jgi:hypothetical protein
MKNSFIIPENTFCFCRQKLAVSNCRMSNQELGRVELMNIHRPDDGGSKDFWNVGELPDYTALQPRRQPSSKLVGFLKNYHKVSIKSFRTRQSVSRQQRMHAYQHLLSLRTSALRYWCSLIADKLIYSFILSYSSAELLKHKQELIKAQGNIQFYNWRWLLSGMSRHVVW